MNYLKELGFSNDDIVVLNNSLQKSTIETLELFPKIVEENYKTIKDIGVKNHKDIFIEHTHMFLMNPDKFKAIFAKYDHDDLIRCLEKNAAVIEKL